MQMQPVATVLGDKTSAEFAALQANHKWFLFYLSIHCF